MIVYTVVKHTEIERLTREGWKFEQIIASSKVEISKVSAPVAVQPSSNGGSGWIDYAACREVPVIVNEPLFMLSKDMETVTREEGLLVQGRKLYNETQVAKAALEEAQSLAIAANQKVEELTAELATVRERSATSSRLRIKLEDDLARVRAAIGELKFKEIVDAS